MSGSAAAPRPSRAAAARAAETIKRIAAEASESDESPKKVAKRAPASDSEPSPVSLPPGREPTDEEVFDEFDAMLMRKMSRKSSGKSKAGKGKGTNGQRWGMA